MVESRWLRWSGRALVALGAVGLIAVDDARRRCRGRGSARPCAGAGGADRGGARSAAAQVWRACAARPGSGSTRSSTAMARWPVSACRSASTATRSPGPWTCPAESFAAGPFGRVVLVGADDGVRVAPPCARRRGGCAWAIADERRRHPARDDRPAGHARSTRCGSTARRAPTSVSGCARSTAASARQVLAAARRPTIGSVGRSSTEFTWDLAGDRLAVQSCGEVACRTRVLDPDGGPTATLDEPDLGLARRSRRGPARDLRGLPRPPLPDRRDRPRHRRPSDARRRWRTGCPRRRRRTAPGSSTRRRWRGSRLCVGRRSMAVPATDLGPDPGRAASASGARPGPMPRPGCRPAGSCSPPTVACRPIRPLRRPQLRHLPDGADRPAR